MICIWLITVFNVYLIQYLLSTFKNEFGSAFGASISDITSKVFGGVAFAKLTLKTNYKMAFAISAIGGVLVWTWGLQH